MRARFTAATLGQYKPSAKVREISDAGLPMLRLRIQPRPSGSRSWVMRFRRPGGRSGILTLGPVQLGPEITDEPVIGAPLTLGQARQLAQQIARKRATGVDVITEQATKKARQRTKHLDLAANTFGATVREFFAEYKTRKWGTRPRRWRDDARLLGLDWPKDADPAEVAPTIVKGSLADIWGDRPLANIDAHDCFTMIDESTKRGIPGLELRNRRASDARGRKMHAALSVLFKWAVQRRKVATNPITGLWHPGAPPARERMLDDDEIKVFWRATDNVTVPFGACLKLLLLTGCRSREVSDMRWSELGEDGTWTISSERTKNHRPHTLRLPPLARSIISEVPRIEGEFVFSSTGKSPISGWSKIKQSLDKQMEGVPAWRMHDLRRSAASGMQRLGIRTEIIERTLNHISASFRGVAGTYQRDALTEEVTAALLRWSLHIAGLVADDEPVKITNIAERRKARRS